MTVYREFDNTVKMHLNTHLSVHTSQRDDFILFSCNFPQGPRSKFPCAILASFEVLVSPATPPPPHTRSPLKKKFGTKLRFLRKENFPSMFKRRFEKIAVERK